MKENGIKKRILNEIVQALIKGEKLKDFHIKLFTSSSEIHVDDIGDVLVKKRESNSKLEERFPNRQSIIHELSKHVIATKNSEYIYHFMANTYSVPKDELSDALIATKDYETICSAASSILGIKVNKFVEVMIKYGKDHQLYSFIDNTFCCNRNAFEEEDNKQEILDKLVNALLKTNERSYITSLANLNISGISISVLEDWAIGTSPLAIYDFASKVEKADKNRLMNALIQLKNPCYSFYFAKFIKGANINKLFDVIVEYDDDHWFDQFVKEIHGLSKDKIVEGILKRNYYSYIFDKNLKLTKNQINTVIEKVISLDAETIYMFASRADNTRKDNNFVIKKLADGIIQTNNALFIYKFARNIHNAPIESLGNALINIGSPMYIFLFVKDIYGVNAEKYADAIINAENVYWMYRYANEIPNAPVEKLFGAIKKITDKE